MFVYKCNYVHVCLQCLAKLNEFKILKHFRVFLNWETFLILIASIVIMNIIITYLTYIL